MSMDSLTEDLAGKGPAVGTRFPEIVLPDQTGAPVRLHEARRGRKALVVFYRSARW
jgi:peroxiredoxin